MRRKKLAIAIAPIILALLGVLVIKTWAASLAAHFSMGESAIGERSVSAAQLNVPQRVRFRRDDRGLLVRTWVNDTGAYTFALDTGAGEIIISERVAREAGVSFRTNRQTTLGGLSGSDVLTGYEATIRDLSIGESNNKLSSKLNVIVTNRLPPGIDGLLDPTLAYWPLGYRIDFPNNEMSAFDPRISPLSDTVPHGGAIVPWISKDRSRRPFIRLDDGQSALIDTGSRFGFAISDGEARAMGIRIDEGEARGETRDFAGQRIVARRIAPVTVRIGPMILRRVPTDVLFGAGPGAPRLLGREALEPFQLAFDPINRLIQFAPAAE